MIGKHISSALRALAPAFSNLIELALMIGGAGLISFGAWRIYEPAGYITAGVLLIVGVVFNAKGS
jgi:hypothetical protein